MPVEFPYACSIENDDWPLYKRGEYKKIEDMLCSSIKAISRIECKCGRSSNSDGTDFIDIVLQYHPALKGWWEEHKKRDDGKDNG
jgi:hypothetical protein